MTARIVLSLTLLLAACAPECPETAAPDAGPTCEAAPDWAAELDDSAGIIGCGWTWDENGCAQCEVFFSLHPGDETLVVPGGLCGQVPFCARLQAGAYNDAGMP